MPELEGTIQSTMQDRFLARFIMPDGRMRTFDTSIDPPVTNMTINAARLSYDNDDQLTGSDSFKGTVGTVLTITLDKGPKMSGPLQEPVSPTQAAVGSGDWAET